VQDPDATDDTFHIRHGAYLPHWSKPGAIYAVTFRLADSLPQSVLEAWVAERDAIVKRAGQADRPLSQEEEKHLRDLHSDKVEKYLDAAHGRCWLKQDAIARIVAEALSRFDCERYRLVAWCIMPNHVHAVVQPLPGHGLPSILHTWKSYTAKEANKLLGRRGTFWQPEYYDHMIRDERDLAKAIEYVLMNPEMAGLKDWKWKNSCGTGVPPVGNHGQDADTTTTDHGQDAHATSIEHARDVHATHDRTFGPEDVFDYMYAVFHSPTYRSRYAEFLKIDFPRLPLTSKVELFRELCALGEELVGLHLMEKHGPRLADFLVEDDNKVEKVRYTAPGQGADKGRVWINKTQYFDGVPPEVWEFHIGGYQVCQKWLKDRKGRQLSFDDVKHYQHIVSALAETIRIMAEIDRRIDKHGGWPIQ
jgi:REP element-mobilizing transposase RayT